ncbi:hypothetical protein MP228_008783 [Amoeboaphelidium protococcarum]|nr:hypothetical protein MP228_008783 [Amoeboaphelidium protococcarum]
MAARKALLVSGIFVSSISLICFVWTRNKKVLKQRLNLGYIKRLLQSMGQMTLNNLPSRVNDPSGLIGNTPMCKLPHLSQQLSDEIGIKVNLLVKCEFMNPGGSSKDRVAKSILDHYEQCGVLNRDEAYKYTVYEGTVGSTGISLAWQCKSRGYNCHICMPDDVAQEKVDLLLKYGAIIERLRPVSIVDQNNYVNVARQRAQDDPYGVFANQFEVEANFIGHYEHTAPEIYAQCDGIFDYFVMGSGTGGTLAGCARYFKNMNDQIMVVLADPQGSGLYNKVKHDVMYASTEAEGRRRRHQIDTLVEGVGINRMTKNMEMILGRGRFIQDTYQALKRVFNTEELNQNDDTRSQLENAQFKWVDDAYKVTDKEAVLMARYLCSHEGLFVGSSSAVNLVACVKLIKDMKNFKQLQQRSEITIVTLLCDSGNRHLSKFWNDDLLQQDGLITSEDLDQVRQKEYSVFDLIKN